MKWSPFSWVAGAATALVSVALLGNPVLVQAGCGCTKPPPALASVRPNVTYAGQDVTVFHAALQAGQLYTVTFNSGISGETKTISAHAVLRRDLADGQLKPQLITPLPPLPLGPTSISVQQAGQSGAVLMVSDDAFTVAPQPVVVPAQFGRYEYRDFQAAVSRQGVVYLSLDLTNVTDPVVFQARIVGYPLRFRTDDAVFYNTQGYLMQLLNQEIPGLAAVAPIDKAKESDILQYARHEFNSFFLAHHEREAHEVDAADPNWHADGTRHVDHNHLILALAGQLSNNSTPPAGATPKFKLRLAISSLFSAVLVGRDDVEIGGGATTDGDVQSNGVITVNDTATVDGDATGAEVVLNGNKKQVKSQGQGSQPGELLPVYMPQLLTDLGEVVLTGNQTLTLGPGAYKISNLILHGNSRLLIDNVAEAVTLYVTGIVDMSGSAAMVTTATGPEDFSLYVQGGGNVMLVGAGGSFHGLVYAPDSVVDIAGQGDFYGAFVGKALKVSGNVALHYDTTSDVVKAKKAKKPKK
jgi:hypothetical protein